MLKTLRSILSVFQEPLKTGMRYRLNTEPGRCTSVHVSDNGFELNNLLVFLQHKITSEDVMDGKLTPISMERVKRRGAKRTVGLSLSYKDADELHKVLGTALKDARKRRSRHYTYKILFSYLDMINQQI